MRHGLDGYCVHHFFCRDNESPRAYWGNRENYWESHSNY